MGSEYPDAIDMFIPTERVFSNAQPRGTITDHKTAGFNNAFEVAKYFATNSLWTSSHFVIGLDGTVIQCVSLADGAGANCCLNTGYDPYWDRYKGVNLNLVTISIEHVDNHRDSSGLFDNQGQCPPAQIAASVKLHLWLRDNLGIHDAMPHSSIDPINRARCPGNFPMDMIRNAMAQKEVPQVLTPSANQDKAFHTQWHAKIATLPTDTGIYHAWVQERLKGNNLNAPTTTEYPNINWDGIPIIVQEGGNWWIEWYPNGRKDSNGNPLPNYEFFTL